MAIARRGRNELSNGPQVIKTPPNEPVKTQHEDYRGVTVDTRYIGLDQTVTHISGMSWTADLLTQVLERDDALQSFQMDLHSVYQSYKRHRGFVLKVQSPLTSTQDSAGKQTALTGTAMVYSCIVPNVKDLILADIGDGREGVFEITESEKKSHYIDTVHEITYTLLYENTQEIADILDKKTIHTVYFDEDRYLSGLSPFLTKEQMGRHNDAIYHYKRLVSMYFKDFLSLRFNTVIVPNQLRVTYDPFVVKFLKATLSSYDHPGVETMVDLNVTEDRAMFEYTIWNCLLRMDSALLSMSVHEAGLVDVDYFFSMPLYNSVYYSGVEKVVYPDMKPTDVDTGYDPHYNHKQLDHTRRGRTRFNEMNRIVVQPNLEMDPTRLAYEPAGRDSVPMIHRVTMDNYYVFSKAFYRHDVEPGEKLSRLEQLAYSAMERKSIDIEELMLLAAAAPKWDNVERFYYVPILLHLLRIAPRFLR